MMSRPRLVIASNNRGKISEFRDLLGNDAEVVSMRDLGIDSPEETGGTFEENAELKALHVQRIAGEVTLADDSGLEVDALDGMPGVRSARYAGEDQNDADNRALLIRNLEGVPGEQRTSRFVAAISLAMLDGTVQTVRGTCEGAVGCVERGENGFGYDPLFVIEDGRTMAELTSSEKSRFSHRGKALRAILPLVRSALHEHSAKSASQGS